MTETLFERMSAAQAPRAHARSTDPETSHMAAEHVTPGLNELQLGIELLTKRFPDGFTHIDIVELQPFLKPSTTRSRVAELAARNVIIDTGERVRPPGEKLLHTIWKHRQFVDSPDPLIDPTPRIKKADKLAGQAMADELDKAAKQMRAEGRTGFSDQLTEAAALIRRLSQ